MSDELREILLETIETALRAQLRAIRGLRQASGSPPAAPDRKPRTGRSQLSVVYDILHKAAAPLHITEIIEIAQKRFREKLDRESLVSALTKRIARGDRFLRTAPNTFTLLAQEFRKGAE